MGGSRVATYYLPFCNYRGTAPNQTITDRDFTGQPQNRAVGLLYYQARFYVPGIGRFASADTLVPNPTNPQSYNRYSYVENRPLNLTDPTGHYPCGPSGICLDDSPPPTSPPILPLATPLAGMYKAGTKIYKPDPDRNDPLTYHNGQDLKSDVTTNLRAVTTGYVK